MRRQMLNFETDVLIIGGDCGGAGC